MIREQARSLAARTTVSEEELLNSDFTDKELHFIVREALRLSWHPQTEKVIQTIPNWTPPTYKTYDEYLAEKGLEKGDRYKLARA